MTKFQKLLLTVSVIVSSSTIYAETKVDSQNSKNTTVTNDNGVTIIDIEKPNDKGVSINYFDKFNVVDKGTVINNSLVEYNSQLAGQINKNKNFSDKAASIAVLKVLGNDKTYLKSILEAATNDYLELYISNENGIDIDGATFSNIDRTVLTTGKIDDNLNILTKKGNINIYGSGIKGAKYLDIITTYENNTSTIKSNGTVNVILGKNFVNKDLEILYKDDTVKIDASNLGSIYSNQIFVASTAKGVGVNTKDLVAADKISIKTNGDLTNKGKIVAKNSVDLSAHSIYNTGKVEFKDDFYEIKWKTKDGKELTLEEVNNVWVKHFGKKLSHKDTYLQMAGSLLDKWAYDYDFLVKNNVSQNVIDKFRAVLKELNLEDPYATITRDDLDKISEKQRDGAFVNQGDYYETMVNDKKILEAIAISKVKAEQAEIRANDINLKAEHIIENKDANILADNKLNIESKFFINSNTLSKEIELRDGYEHIKWEINPLYNAKHNIYDLTYDINYDRGIRNDDKVRKTQLTAINTSHIKGKDININSENIYFLDKVKVSDSIIADNLNVKSDRFKITNQDLSINNIDIKSKLYIYIDESKVLAENANLNTEKLKFTSKNNFENTINREIEQKNMEIPNITIFNVLNDLNINTKDLNLEGAILNSNNRATINSLYEINVLSKIVNSEYHLNYDIPKTFRKISNNEKVQHNLPSYIRAKELKINTDLLRTKASVLKGEDKLEINNKTSIVETSETKNEIHKNIGIDNGFLGINYSKLDKNEKKNIGSLVTSTGDIIAKIEDELTVIGSKIKGNRVDITAKNVDIKSAVDTTVVDIDERHLLGGNLHGTTEMGTTKDSISMKVDMDIYKKENSHYEEEKNKGSLIEGNDVSIKAENNINITGSNIEGNNIELVGKNITINSKTTENLANIEKVEHSIGVRNKIKIGQDGENGIGSGFTYTTKKTNEEEKLSLENKSEIKGSNITIKADNINIETSDIGASNVNIEANKTLDIKSKNEKREYSKETDTLDLSMDVKFSERLTSTLIILKDLLDVRENLMGYLTNPANGINKVNNIRKELSENYKKIKEITEQLQYENIDPKKIGLSITTEGDIRYNKTYIKLLIEKAKSSNIIADNLNITSNKLNLTSSNIKANEKANINVNEINLNSTENKTKATEISFNAHSNIKHDIVSDKTSGKVEMGIGVRGETDTKHINSTIQAKEVNIKSNSLNLNGGDIKGNTVNIETDSLTKNNKFDSNLKYNFESKVGYNSIRNKAKAGIDSEVKYDKTNLVESKIESDNLTLKYKSISENTEESKTNLNAKLKGSIELNESGLKGGSIKGGFDSKLSSKLDNVNFDGLVGLNGGFEFDEEGEILNPNVEATTTGIITIEDNSLLENTKIVLNNNIKYENNDVNIDVNGNATTTIKVTDPNNLLSGKIKLDGNLGTTINKNGVKDIVSSLKEKSELLIKGKTDDVNGSFAINTTGEVGTNKEGINKLEGSIDSKGELNIHKENENALANLHILTTTSTTGGLNKETETNINVKENGELTLKGTTDNVEGHITFISSSEFDADKKGINKLEGNLSENGRLTFKGEKDFVSGNLNILTEGNISGGLNKELETNINVKENGTITIKGTTDKVDGHLTFTTNSELGANKKGLTKLEGNVSESGRLTLKGEKDFISGNLNILTEGNISGGLNKELETNLNVKGDGDLTLKGEYGTAKGDITVVSNGEFDLNKQGINKLEGNVISNGHLNLKGEYSIASNNFTLNTNTEISGGLNKETYIGTNANADGRITIKGKKDNVEGLVDVDLTGNIGISNLEGLHSLNGKAGTDAKVYIHGIEKPVEGDLLVNLKGITEGGIDKDILVQGGLNTDANLNVDIDTVKSNMNLKTESYIKHNLTENTTIFGVSSSENAKVDLDFNLYGIDVKNTFIADSNFDFANENGIMGLDYDFNLADTGLIKAKIDQFGIDKKLNVGVGLQKKYIDIKTEEYNEKDEDVSVFSIIKDLIKNNFKFKVVKDNPIESIDNK